MIFLYLAGFSPGTPSLLQQGLAALQQGNLPKARQTLEQASHQDAHNPYIWTSLAETYLRLGEAKKASEAAGTAGKIDSGNPIVAHALAMYYSEAKQFETAAEWEQKYAASPKADADAVSRTSMLYLRAQDFTRAAEVVEGDLKTHPDDAQLNLTLGVARYGQRRFDEAIRAFLKVIQIDPAIPQPYLFLGRMLDQAGSYLGQITKDDEAWVAAEPGNAKAQLMLAKALLATDSRSQRAEELLKRSISLASGDWEAHYELGVLLVGKHDYPGAAAELTHSVELDPKQAMPHYQLARVYDRLGQPDRAKGEREIHQQLTSAPLH